MAKKYMIIDHIDSPLGQCKTDQNETMWNVVNSIGISWNFTL